MSAETPEEGREMVRQYHDLVPAGGEHENAQIIAFMRGWSAGRDWQRSQPPAAATSGRRRLMARPMDVLMDQLENELSWALSRVDNKPHQIEPSLLRMRRLLAELREAREAAR